MQVETHDNGWCVVEEGFAIGANLHWESLLALGTGYITTRASIEEGFDDDDQSLEYDRIPGNVSLETIPARKSRWGTYMPVVQAKHPLWRLGIVNLPYALGLRVSADGERLDLEKSTIVNYRRWLNLKTATLYRYVEWHTRNGKTVNVLFKRFMNPKEKFVCVQECFIEAASGATQIHIESVVDNNVRTNGFDTYAKRIVGKCDNDLIFSDVVTNVGNRIVTASQMIVEAVTDYVIEQKERLVTVSGAFEAVEGGVSCIRKVSVTAADLYFDGAQLLDEAREILKKTLSKRPEVLYKEHTDVWAARWLDADIEIDARDRKGYNSQLAIRLSIYHLLRTMTTDESRGLICPKGTTTEVYMGSVFWDMEIFIEPFYIYTNPAMARNVHMFRYRNLPAARMLTEKAGYPGVRYPWMSAANGTETCPMWEYADHQVHITSDVVIGIWHYFRNTLDEDFLFNYGAEIILETARYWTHRAEKVQGRPGYQIYGVMGPDEYKPLSNNNAYTNHSAKFNLALASKVVTLMIQKAPEKLSALMKQLSLSDAELERFREVERGISIPRDGERNVIWQCEDFDTAFVKPDIDAIWQDKSRLFGTYYSQEKRYRSKTLKQADVVALLAVFSEDYSMTEKAASFDYYSPITIHDSSNSMCHHQMVLAQMGRADAAYEAWLRSIDIDYGALSRATNGIHCANVGGMWQEVVFGFCGMISALNSDILTFRPCLPSEFRSIKLKLQWKRQWVEVTVMRGRITVCNLSTHVLSVMVNNKEYRMEALSTNKMDYDTTNV